MAKQIYEVTDIQEILQPDKSGKLLTMLRIQYRLRDHDYVGAVQVNKTLSQDDIKAAVEADAEKMLGLFG